MGDARLGIQDQNLYRAQPFVIAVITVTAALMLTLSQQTYMSTYLVLGLATAYLRLTDASTVLKWFRVDFLLIKRLAIASVSFLVGINIFVRLFN